VHKPLGAISRWEICISQYNYIAVPIPHIVFNNSEERIGGISFNITSNPVAHVKKPLNYRHSIMPLKEHNAERCLAVYSS